MNKFLEFFLTKIILFALVSFFHFSVYAEWEASEENCGASKIAEGLNMIDEPVPDAEGTPSGRVRKVFDPQVQAEYDGRKRDCDRFDKERDREREAEEEEEEKLEELAKEQADKLEKEREKALEEQQKMIESAKNECTSSYEQVVRERQDIEHQVQNIQQQLDKIEDAITKNYASISEGEDQIHAEILKLKQEERQAMNMFKQEKIKAEHAEQQGERALVQTIEEIENTLFESASTLGDMVDFKEQICSSRSMEYLRVSVECYNEKLKQVTIEREELFKRIRTGRYETASLNNLFQTDSQNIDQTFKRRLDALHAHCFQERTGENLPHPGQSLVVQIPCDLKAFEHRVEACRKNNNNHKVCPVTPDVQVIEQKVLAQLRKVEKDRVKVERARESALKEIEKLKEENEESKGWIAKALADLEEQLRLAKNDFKERHERAENELKRIRERAENSILQLERDKIRLLASDPARHFEEKLIVARASCCHSASAQQTAQQCTLLSRYEQDSTRFQFAFIRPLPALRSASGPSSTTSNTKKTSTSGGGVQ